MAGGEAPSVELKAAIPGRGSGSSAPHPPTPERTFSGRVVDDATGDPIPGVLLVAGSQGLAIPKKEIPLTAQDGRFSLAVAPDSLVRLIHRGHLPIDARAVLGQDTEFRMLRGAEIRGRVVDDAGAPVEGVSVQSVPVSARVGWPRSEDIVVPSASLSGGTAVTLADGSFRLSGHEEVHTYEILASKPYWTTQEWGPPRTYLAKPGAVNVEIVMRPFFELVTAIEEPPGVRFAYSVQTTWPLGYTIVPATGLGSYDPSTTARPDATIGPARSVTRLVPDKVHARRAAADAKATVRLTGWGVHAKTSGVPIRLGAREALTIRLEPEDGRVSEVVFLARFPSGRLFSGDLVLTVKSMTRGSNASWSALVTFKDGRSVTPLLLPHGRDYRVLPVGTGKAGSWWTPAGDVAEARLAAPKEEIALTLRGSVVHLEVRDAHARPARGYTLRVQSGSQDSTVMDWDRIASDGITNDQHVWMRPGESTFRVNLSEVGSAERLVRLGANGESYSLVLDLLRGKEYLPMEFER
jgi:hypothetical protein